MIAPRMAASLPSVAPPSCLRRGKHGAKAARKPGSAQALSEALVDRGYVKKRNNVGQQGFCNLVVKA